VKRGSCSNGSGQRIATVRRKLRLTQGAFAARVGVTRNAVIRYEHGALPRAKVLDRIAQAGGVTVEWILRGQGVARTRFPRADRKFDEAVSLLWTLWPEPSRRATIVSVLKALQPP
jgi:transcriptional regulator with XRE-family HTH domain